MILRPLTSERTAVTFAHQLLDIFLVFGAPSILQSDSDSEFTAGIITELEVVWLMLVVVYTIAIKLGILKGKFSCKKHLIGIPMHQ